MKNEPIVKYDDRHDVMHVFITSRDNFFSEEEFPGVYVNRNEDTGEIRGFTVLDYERMNKPIVQKHFPEYFH
ncbi:MAG: DUF2283 domain-containing protein [Selenomonadaceae bacterium]|nr:DUF2283 domain-containing protein [Selenomonadaceae bacterium]